MAGAGKSPPGSDGRAALPRVVICAVRGDWRSPLGRYWSAPSLVPVIGPPIELRSLQLRPYFCVRGLRTAGPPAAEKKPGARARLEVYPSSWDGMKASKGGYNLHKLSVTAVVLGAPSIASRQSGEPHVSHAFNACPKRPPLSQYFHCRALLTRKSLKTWTFFAVRSSSG